MADTKDIKIFDDSELLDLNEPEKKLSPEEEKKFKEELNLKINKIIEEYKNNSTQK